MESWILIYIGPQITLQTPCYMTNAKTISHWVNKWWSNENRKLLFIQLF